jgi:transcriptional regulator with XRE-family HTH domain
VTCDARARAIDGASATIPGVWWSREKTEIAEFLYKILISEAPRGYARQVAAKMGVPYPTLSKYWLGKRRFPASLVKPLFLATDEDVRIAEFFVLGGSRYRLERTGEIEPSSDLPRAVMMLATLEAKITGLYLAATEPASEAGERVSAGEAEALRGAVQQLITHAERLRAALKPPEA